MSSPPHFLSDLEQVIKSLCCLICPACKMDQTFIRNCFVSLYHCAQQIFLFKMHFFLHPHWDLHTSASESDTQTPITEQTQWQGEQNQPNKHQNQIFWAKVSFVSWWRSHDALYSLLRKWLILISGTQRGQTSHSEGCAPALLPCGWALVLMSGAGWRQDHRWNENNNPQDHPSL